MKGVIRPEAVILPESAVLPATSLIYPPPNAFTHRTTRALPYRYDAGPAGSPPVGELPAGASVVVLRREDERRCRAVDERGLYVVVDSDGLEPL